MLATLLVLVLAGLAACSGPDVHITIDLPRPSATPKGATETPSSPSPSASPSAVEHGTGPAGRISLTNLTFGHAEATPLVTTAEIRPQPNRLVLAHIMGFRPGGLPPPTLSGGGLTWTLVGGNLEGEKRHWVFRGIGPDPTTSAVSIDWGGAPTETLWVIDAVSGAATGNDGADAIVQFVSQESQRNASGGSIVLEPFADPANAAVCFALAGSGAASDIAPLDGFTETAEADNPGQNLIVSDFWKVGGGTSCDADFDQDSTGQKQIESWLFLAIELRAANT